MGVPDVAIVGSGPAGLSAACHAARAGVSHVLLESSPHIANTIQRYQKGKHVMAEPMILPLRADVEFAAGTRENILATWQDNAEKTGANIRYNAEVKAIDGEHGHFRLTLADGDVIEAATVVLAIGVQGNLRTLGVPGEDLPCVQYQLDDPDAYRDETIVVVGGGDAGIENALALATHNRIVMINRNDDFSRAKDANGRAITQAIDNPRAAVDGFYKASIAQVEPLEAEAAGTEGFRARVTIQMPDEEATVDCHRVIARLGAIPPRRFVEACGVEFSSNDPGAMPAVDSTYQSNVPGLYIIGALAGYPLIKQGLNQGFEVIERIRGEPVEPADTPLLRERFANVPGGDDIDAMLDRIRGQIPLLAPLTTLQLREFLLDSTIHVPEPGTTLFAYGDYSNSIHAVLQGEVWIQPGSDEAESPPPPIRLPEGQFCGELSLISGRRRAATVKAGADCIVIESPRRSVLTLMRSIPAVQRVIDETFLVRAIQARIAPGCSADDLAELVESAQIERFAAGEALFEEGERGDCLQLVRSGSVTVSRRLAGRDVVLAYLPAGEYVGEMALMSDAPRSATVRAATATETIRLEGDAFKRLMAQHPDVRDRVSSVYRERVEAEMSTSPTVETGNILSFLISQGVGEATDVLLIDESLCIRCDYCERACADTHGGVSRLNREAGPTFASVHVPTSCRHCEHPHCMKDCPPNAIHRNPNGEVYIDGTCIGCGNCERNCPYGVIQMGIESDRPPGILAWFLGLGDEPGTDVKIAKSERDHPKAVKCDMCQNLDGGPACVRACPTGAAMRVSPEEFLGLAGAER